jgi:hypothetical protein
MPSLEPAIASWKRSSLSRSAASAWRRSVTSTVAPAIRSARPLASRNSIARFATQRISPRRWIRYSMSRRGVLPAMWSRTACSTRA